jgi:hypothetical protein
VRVTLDVHLPAAGRLAGSISYDGGGSPVAFDGWLELMRLLESITAGELPPTGPHGLQGERARSPHA